MSLPKLNTETNEWKELVLPSGKKMSIRRWRVKEKKDFLFAIDGVEDEPILEKEIEKLIMSCADNAQIFKDLSESDLIYLGVELRRLSKGDEMEISYTCPHCKGKYDIKIDISKIIDVKKFDVTPFKVSDDLTINFKELSSNVKKKLDEQLIETKKMTRYNYEYLLASVDSILYKEELFDKFTRDELDVFLEGIPDDDFEKLFVELQNRMGHFSIAAKINCINPQCNKNVSVTFGGLTSFFAL